MENAPDIEFLDHKKIRKDLTVYLGGFIDQRYANE